METTIIYYTSNRENEDFAQKIRHMLMASIGELPLISVSQKPIKNFGQNICIGDIGISEENILIQMLVGCRSARTPFVTFAEADTLYPFEYFTFTPDDLNKRYWFEPVYILYHNKDNFYCKGRSDSAHMAGRKYVMKLLYEAIGEKRTMKWQGKDRPTRVELSAPIISVKTGNGMRPKTQTSLTPVAELPYWGKAKDLRKDLCLI